MSSYDSLNIETTLRGLTLKSLTLNKTGESRVTLETTCGRTFVLYHSQDCCESVTIYDTKGAKAKVIGVPLLKVTEALLSGGSGRGHDDEWPEDASDDGYRDESWTWTIYTFHTDKGTYTIRWLGSSNGYYSESVSFCEEGGRSE